MPRYFPLKIFPLFAVLLSLCPQFAAAAPFCVSIQGVPQQCDYYDALECRHRASQLNATCTANGAEIMLPPGSGKYCVVDSNRITQCIYPDRPNCEAEASRLGAVCIDNTPSLGVQQDLHRLAPNRDY